MYGTSLGGVEQLMMLVYIPTGKLHLHGHFDPTSRRVRSTLAEAEPLITKC